MATRGTQERGLTRLRDIRQENHRETRDFRNLEESGVLLWGKDNFSSQTFYGKKFDFPPSRATEGGCRS